MDFSRNTVQIIGDGFCVTVNPPNRNGKTIANIHWARVPTREEMKMVQKWTDTKMLDGFAIFSSYMTYQVQCDGQAMIDYQEEQEKERWGGLYK